MRIELKETSGIIYNGSPINVETFVTEFRPVLDDGTPIDGFVELTINDVNVIYESLDEVRNERNKLLAETDWRFRSDLNPSQEWIDYCQTLRDLPENISDLSSVQWPTKPI